MKSRIIADLPLHSGAAPAWLFRRMVEMAGAIGILIVREEGLRSLSLLAEVIYNVPASRRDPAAYSFAHGGKDGHPYHVNWPLYDANIERLRETINRARLGHTDKSEALKSLARFTERL